ncbi:hypothetical protein AGABI2DRAFT_177042 [Agaricus bisporus var. bisporus H97]|uniref:hypothetical protein n=1 Tax=Agaricus bisporus var. bisporus (strain H97 / ATCC MYA-4626 / FGSC 10389) TaxID=936046 RepID=UPI00029F5ECD|nr:hypothetical protein AGABI2DRAFT_177042 [Agaricus bisporus var. bisporus H97]EKV48804.1 hypothetical protein AGABI2DRAFT_177042 [Agaricus bisporus var. bisporus H97]
MAARYGLLLLTFLLSPVFAAASVNVTFPAQPPSVALLNTIEDNFIGISWELSSFDSLWGTTVDKQPSAMQNYLHNLISRMSKPLRIRVGGNSMDGSSYVPDQTTPLVLTDPNAYFNDVPVNFGPALFDIMNGMSDKVGAMQFMIGLSMRFPERWNEVLRLAQDTENKLGDRLDALLLGNEPDLYAGHGERGAYSIKDYVPEIDEVMGLLGNNSLLERPIIGGPTICCTWELDDLFKAGFDEFNYKYYTVQHYPNNICNGENESNTNLTYYLTHANIEGFLEWQKEGVIKAKKQNIPVLLTEYNTVSCGGSKISSTFGAGLWAIDTGLKATTMNYSAVYLHTREHGVQYNLFDPPTPETSTEPGWITGSPYYSALFLSEVADPSGSIVVDLNVNKSNTNQFATVAGYGIYDGSGQNRSGLVLINYASPTQEGDDKTQQFSIPANVTDKISYRILTAPSVTEKTDITWAGQTVGVNGDLQGAQHTESLSCDEGCLIDVPGPGAVLAVFGKIGEQRLFTGNSTIAPLATDTSGSGVIFKMPPFSLSILVVLAFIFL